MFWKIFLYINNLYLCFSHYLFLVSYSLKTIQNLNEIEILNVVGTYIHILGTQMLLLEDHELT